MRSSSPMQGCTCWAIPKASPRYDRQKLPPAQEEILAQQLDTPPATEGRGVQT